MTCNFEFGKMMITPFHIILWLCFENVSII